MKEAISHKVDIKVSKPNHGETKVPWGLIGKCELLCKLLLARQYHRLGLEAQDTSMVKWHL
jgi:hypothetical protein